MKLRGVELLAVATACSLSAPLAAHASTTERRRGVDVVVHRTYADVFVMTTFTNDSEAPGMIEASVGLDDGFVVGFSMMAPDGGWSSASILPAAEASSRFFDQDPLVGSGDPFRALLSLQRGAASIVATIPGSSDQILALQIMLPIDAREQSRGKLTLPSFDYAASGATHIRLADGLTGLVVDGKAQDGDVSEVESAQLHELGFDAPSTELVAGDLAVLDTTGSAEGGAPSEAVVDYRLDAGTRLGEVPNDAHVVVIVDMSRSIRSSARSGAIGAAKSFVSNFEAHRGEVAVVAFDRSAETLTTGASGPFVSPTDAMNALTALTTRAPRNGSSVDLALAEASRILSAIGGTRRVVLFTDTETSDRIDPGSLEDTRPLGALLHVVRVADAGSPGLYRDDASPWSELARATGGVLWAASVGGDAEAQRPVFEELARPKRLDHVKLVPAAGGEPIDIGTIPEGGRVRRAEVAPPPGASMTIEGDLWSTPFSRKLEGSTAYRKLAIGRLFSTGGLASNVDPSERQSLASFAHVLSPATSFLVCEGGPVALATEQDYGGSRGEGISLGSIGTLGRGRGYASTGMADGAMLRALLPLASACSRASGAFTRARIDVHVETTRGEIVDVAVVGAPSEELERCIVDRTWELELDPAFDAIRHRHWVVHTLDTL